MIQSARLRHQMKPERGHHRLPCCLRHHYCLQQEMINCTKFELVAVSNVAYSVFLYRYSDTYRYYSGSHDRLIICGSCMLDFPFVFLLARLSYATVLPIPLDHGFFTVFLREHRKRFTGFGVFCWVSRKATPDFLFFRSQDSSFVAGLRLFFFTTPYLHKEPEKLDDTYFLVFLPLLPPVAAALFKASLLHFFPFLPSHVTR